MVAPFEGEGSSVTCHDVMQEQAVRLFRRELPETGKDLRAFVVRDICKEILLHELPIGFFEEVNTGFVDKTECAVGFDTADELRSIVDDRIVEPGPCDQFVLGVLLRDPGPDKIDQPRDLVCHIGSFLQVVVGPGVEGVLCDMCESLCRGDNKDRLAAPCPDLP